MPWYLQSMQVTPVNRWRHLATKLQQTNWILWGYITNSRDHMPLSKQLRHTLFWILQWNKQPSGMTINHLGLPRWLLRHSFRLFIPLKNPCIVSLTYTCHFLQVHGITSENINLQLYQLKVNMCVIQLLRSYMYCMLLCMQFLYYCRIFLMWWIQYKLISSHYRRRCSGKNKNI